MCIGKSKNIVMKQTRENRSNTRSPQKSQKIYIIRFSSVSSTFKEQVNINAFFTSRSNF